MNSIRERALREMGLAPGWVRRQVVTPGANELPQADLKTASPPLRVELLDLTGLEAAIEHCESCPRAFGRTRAVSGEGPALARLLVVDLVPSRLDAEHGPFGDTDGARLLEQLLFAVGLKREAVYLSHTLRCDGGVPTDFEASCCAPYLRREIELLAPRALLALGAAASRAINVNAAATAELRVFTLPHPAELLSGAASKRAAWATLRGLRAYLGEG